MLCHLPQILDDRISFASQLDTFRTPLYDEGTRP